MEVFHIMEHKGNLMTHFQSHFWLTKLIQTDKPARLDCMVLHNGDVIGFHKAAMPQLMIVIEGGGYVRNDHQTVRVKKGDAVLWEKGENHETFTEDGLTLLTAESEGLEVRMQ